jgi:hypothetical protein
MNKLLISLILCLALTGCGEVVVFGHVVRENPAKTEAAASKPAPESATTTSAAAAQPATEPAATTAEVAVQSVTEPPTPTVEVAAQSATDSAEPTPATEVVAQRASEAAPPKGAIVTSSTPATGQAVAAVAGLPAAHLLHAVNVTLSPASQTDDPRIDAVALQDAIRTELRSRKLLDEQNPSANGTAEVLIESATTHRTVNAVVFGRQPMAGTLTGELRVRGASGELPTSKIVAESRFNIADDGEDKNALGPLYRRFAVLAADELTGTAEHAK